MMQFLNSHICVVAIALLFPCATLSNTQPMCSVIQGLPGLNGRDGRDGTNGQKGEPGSQGQTGARGDKGSIGTPGKAGPAGPKGSQSEKDVAGSLQIAILENKIISIEKSLSFLQNIVLSQMASTTNGNKMFTLSWRQGSFNSAQAICQKYGGNLPIPQNNEENSLLSTLAQIAKVMTNRRIFLGITDIKQEGVFIYPDGKKITYQNWYQNEPNGARVENCIGLHEGKWIDITCDQFGQVVCEFTLL